MNTQIGTRRELIDELLVTRRQAQRLAISLRFQGHDKEAFEAAEKEAKLTAQIDGLLAAAMQTWTDTATGLTARLRNINQTLSASVESVRQRETDVARIAGALGAIDEAIDAVSRLIP
jgi:hypothetical protein